MKKPGFYRVFSKFRVFCQPWEGDGVKETREGRKKRRGRRRKSRRPRRRKGRRRYCWEAREGEEEQETVDEGGDRVGGWDGEEGEGSAGRLEKGGRRERK